MQARLVRRVWRGWNLAIARWRIESQELSVLEDLSCQVIQRAARAHAARVVHGELRAEFHAAQLLQARWRAGAARRYFRAHRWRWYNASEVQRAWRGHAARRELNARRVGDLLDCAEVGDYARLLHYFAAHAQAARDEADDDGNNALHRASRGAAKRTYVDFGCW